MDVRQRAWHGSRRQVLGGAATLAAGGTLAAALARHGLGAALAQGTPVAGMNLNYPELKVTITDQASQLSATQVPAGYVLLTVVNSSKDANSAAVLGPGPGQTMADLMQAAATPTPANAFPPFFYTATIPGGPGELQPGATGQAVIQLAAGDWVVFTEGNQPPAFFKAIGGTPTSQTPPVAAVTITEVDFAFGGYDVSIQPGKQIWEVHNQGKQPHMLVLGQVPAGTTVAQVLQAVSVPEGATPPAGTLKQSDFREVNPAGVLLQSSGTTIWPVLDLPAGHYAALCFVTDPRTGEAHAMEGMIAVFDVGAPTGTPVATPHS